MKNSKKLSENGKTIIVDVDDVCALLMETWLEKYNHDYNDNLIPEKITDWDISLFVKPECGKNIYQYLRNPNLYDNINPVSDSLEKIKSLRAKGYRIIFVTATPIEIAGRKYKWLQDNGFEPTQRDYIEAYDKSVIMGKFMLDDRYENVRDFSGIGILMNKPWNKKYDYPHRVNNWNEFIQKIEGISLW